MIFSALAAGCDSPRSSGTYFDDDASVAEDTGAATDTAASDDTATPPVDAGTMAQDVPVTPKDAVSPPADLAAPPEDTLAPPGDVVTPPEDASPPPDAADDAPPSCSSGRLLCAGMCVDPVVDPSNCGACGNACAEGQRCEAGACISACDAPRTRCGGACVDPSSDPTNCGACGNACSARPNATATCVAGVCGTACSAGRGDCDGDPSNGCETNVNESATHCGRCGVACPGGTLGVCAMGACATSCMPGQTLCGESCADILTSQAHCGACGNVCGNAPNASGRCALGLCQLTCASGYGDCDGDTSNGCETDLRSSVAHCGACGMGCATPPGGSPSCAMGTCSAVCPSGRTACGSACVDTQTDSNHCGACGARCDPGSACGGGTCSIPVLPTRYAQGSSPQSFIDACSASGRLTYLAGSDDGSTRVALPFAFRYWATNMSAGAQINITSNGWIGMLGDTYASLSGSVPSTSLPNGVLAAYWGDNYNRSPGMCVVTTGSAPNRQWVVEWLNAYHYGSGSQSLTFEVVLSETTHTIDFIYQTMSGSSTRTVGIENQTGSLGVGGCAGGGFSCAPSSGYRVRFNPIP